MVNELELDVFFWNSLAFSIIQWMLAIWSLVPLPFLNPAWTSGSSQFTYCWSLAWRIFEHYFASMWDECTYAVVWTFSGNVHIHNHIHNHILSGVISSLNSSNMLVLEKAEESEIKLPTSTGSSRKQESSRKRSTSALLTMPNSLTLWITTNCGKLFKSWEY